MENLSKIWYPYSQMQNMDEPYHVVSAEGVSIKLLNGKSLIDGISSWWCMIHGYRHPELDEAIINQVSKVSHVMLGGLTHEPVLDLTKKLVAITPDGLNHVFYGDSGSIGVEIALKTALQYWRNIGKIGKNKFVALKGAYHGDTFGCMSVCDPDDGMHYLLSDAVIKEYFIDCPPGGFDQENSVIDGYTDKLKKFFEKHHSELAALIVEPVIQTAGGFNIYSPEIIKRMRKLCDDYDILLIFDEIATGFGRTGKYFASNHANVCPDIMVLGKALTGGYMGHSATLSTTEIFEAFYGDDHEKAFMHGPTFMGNPLACAVALKSINIFERDDYLDKIKKIEEQLKNKLFQIRSSKIKDIRVLGAVGVIEVKDEKCVAGFQKFAVENGVWLRPFSRFLYTMP
ncbi:MAG: adenosylmethionine--8-amino-7-oxononanoate transaminase, partial [Candidatus Anammoxibacter sp.]